MQLGRGIVVVLVFSSVMVVAGCSAQIKLTRDETVQNIKEKYQTCPDCNRNYMWHNQAFGKAVRENKNGYMVLYGPENQKLAKIYTHHIRIHRNRIAGYADKRQQHKKAVSLDEIDHAVVVQASAGRQILVMSGVGLSTLILLLVLAGG